MKKLLNSILLSSGSLTLGDEKKNGELLVALFRIIIIVGFIPLIYLMRFLLGYILYEYWLLSIVKWLGFTLIALSILYLLKKGIYSSSMGYITLFLDFAFVTVSIITLSFYKVHHGGVFHDPLFILYYFINVSCGVRYDYRFLIFGTLLSTGIIVLLAYFDDLYHNISPDYILITDRLALLMLTAVISIIIIRLMRDYFFSRYYMGEKHVKEITSLLNIGRKISAKEEQEKTLSRIAGEAGDLLHSDRCIIAVKINESSEIDIIDENGILDISLSEKQVLKNVSHELINLEEALLLDRSDDSKKNDRKIISVFMSDNGYNSLMSQPVLIEDEVAGVCFAVRKEKPAFTEYESTFLALLSEQAAIAIRNAGLLDKLKNESVYLRDEIDFKDSYEKMIGKSDSMQDIYSIIDRAANSDIPVLIRGESGVGKELVADALYTRSSRKSGPFVKINCSAIPADLLESELFGYERGAFTGAHKMKTGKFEQAQGGVIFLDEIGDMSLSLQAKLLRVIQESELQRIGGEATIQVDVRLITATNQDLEVLISNGRFREDLYYRINGLPVYIPPLRERREDIPRLVDHFLEKYYSGKKREVTISAMKFLTSREWKGNVRELENCIHRVLVMTDSEKLTEDDIKKHYNAPGIDSVSDFYSSLKIHTESVLQGGCDISMEIERIEKEFISLALKHSNSNIRKAAEMLNIPKSTLFNKIQKYNIEQ